jgi:K+-transporting ATPase ATPase C chain
MMAETRKQLKVAFKLLILFTLLTGFIYPLAVTGIAQVFFPKLANGSLIQVNNKIIGSSLIGQAFTDLKYFSGRPSATQPFPYNAENSSGSNLGPSNPNFLATVKARVANLQKDNASLTGEHTLPVDLVTASASGLDPEISPRAAYYQVARIAKARKLPTEKVQALVESQIKKRTFGFLGEPRVNILELNVALDNLAAPK